MGLVSDALPFFCRRPLVGYVPVVIGDHHDDDPRLRRVATPHVRDRHTDSVALAFFSGASFIITIPSAIAVFAWIATIWTGPAGFDDRISLSSPASSAMFVDRRRLRRDDRRRRRRPAIDRDLFRRRASALCADRHQSVRRDGRAFIWFPKMTGRMMDEVWGKRTFWLVFAGFNIAFFPMHATGLLGMPRRIYTYPAGVGWTTVNLVSTIGSFILALGILLYFVNVVRGLRSGAAGGPEPMGRAFAGMVGLVAAAAVQFRRDPLCDRQRAAVAQPAWRGRHRVPTAGRPRARPWQGGAGHDGDRGGAGRHREDAGRYAGAFRRDRGDDRRLRRRAAQVWWLMAVGVLSTALGVLVWLWPEAKLAQTAAGAPSADDAQSAVGARYHELPVGSIGRHANGFWGALTLIVTEAALFSYLLFSYYYVAIQHGRDWLPDKLPEFKLSAPDTILLIASSFVVARGEKLVRRAGRAPRSGCSAARSWARGSSACRSGNGARRPSRSSQAPMDRSTIR